MKVLPFKIPKPENNTLVFQVDSGNVFYDKLHQHEEIQISFIVEGEGTLIVGDTVNDYTKGDVLVIGSHIPHMFKSDLDTTKNSHMLSLFFTEQSFGSDFFKLEELKALQPFLTGLSMGLKSPRNKKRLKPCSLKLKMHQN